MARKLKIQNLKYKATTFEGASAYALSKSQPLVHLTFTMGSALLTDGYYTSERQQVRALADALFEAWAVEPQFAWQYGAWMRDPTNGKGNRIQGSLVPALLDAIVEPSEFTERYVAACLSHRPDDVTAFFRHFERLGLGRPSAAARRGMAKALCTFDEYQLMKYAEQKANDVRLCDAIAFVKSELTELGDDAQTALAVGTYLHAPSRDRDDLVEALPLTRARRELWSANKHLPLDPSFENAVLQARVTWEQVVSKFTSAKQPASRINASVWRALLRADGLLGDMAFLRNVRNMRQAGLDVRELVNHAKNRSFKRIWPHQVYAGFRADEQSAPVFEQIFDRMVAKLPKGRHLGIGDASGSMCVRVGGSKGSLTCMDVAFCLVGLMSETSGLGASFADSSFLSCSGGAYLSLVKRGSNETALKFANRRELRRGWGGTQVFGAVMELIAWLREHPNVSPPDCLWFFSDMQFHPGAGAADAVPNDLLALARQRGLGTNVPPLELALKLYRELFGQVDVVLWNLAAYSPVPVPADIEGVLLVSGFDANTLDHVEKWREGASLQPTSGRLVENQNVVLDTIRSY